MGVTNCAATTVFTVLLFLVITLVVQIERSVCCVSLVCLIVCVQLDMLNWLKLVIHCVSKKIPPNHHAFHKQLSDFSSLNITE